MWPSRSGADLNSVRSRFVMQGAHDAQKPPFHLSGQADFILVCNSVTRHAWCRRTELSPCPALKSNMARAGVMGCGWVVGGQGRDLFPSAKPNQQEALCASDNPIFKMDLTALDLTHVNSVPFRPTWHTSPPDGLDRLGIGGRDDLGIKKSLHSPSIGRVRRIRCETAGQLWAALGNFWARLGGNRTAAGKKTGNPSHHQPRPLLVAAALPSRCQVQTDDAR